MSNYIKFVKTNMATHSKTLGEYEDAFTALGAKFEFETRTYIHEIGFWVDMVARSATGEIYTDRVWESFPATTLNPSSAPKVRRAIQGLLVKVASDYVLEDGEENNA